MIILTGVGLTVDGRATLHDTSSGTGTYQIDNVPSNTTHVVVGSRLSYRLTRNTPIAVGSTSVTTDLAMVSILDAARQYTGLGLTFFPGAADVYLTLVDGSGQPLEGVPLSDITLKDSLQRSAGVGPIPTTEQLARPTTAHVPSF